MSDSGQSYCSGAKRGTGALANFMVFLSVKITKTDQARRVVRVEPTEHQARELAMDLIEAADATLRHATLWWPRE